MADAMIGFGIGLSGVPKDYTGIVAARERQKQLGELEKQKQKKSLLDPVMKSIAVDKNLYMDYRVNEIREKTAEFITRAQKAAEANDINDLAMAQQEYNTYIQQMAAERKLYDEDEKSRDSGLTNYKAPRGILRQAKTVEEAEKLAQQYPESFQKTGFNTFIVTPTKRLDLTQIYQRTASNLPVTRIQKTEKDAEGRLITVFEEQIQAPVLEARLKSDYLQDPLIRSNVELNYTGDLSGLTPEQKDKVLQDAFVKNGMDWAGKSGYKILGRSRDINVNVSTGGDQQQAINQPMATDNVQIGTKRGVVDIPVFGSTATGDIVSTFPTSRDLFYTDDNEKVPGGAVTKATYNQVSVGIVANSDIKIPNDAAFLMDYNIPKSVKEYAGETIKAGQLVDPGLRDYLAERGKLRAAVITFGNTEDNYGIYRSASLVQQNNWFKANKQKSPEIESLFNTQRQIESDLTRMYSKGASKTPQKPTGSFTSTAAPSTGGERSLKKPNKHGI